MAPGCRSPLLPPPGVEGRAAGASAIRSQFPAVTLSFNLAAGRRDRPGGRGDPGRRGSKLRICRRPSRARSRAPPRRSGPRCRIGAAIGRRGDPRRLHRARRALRELHPPDHDPVGAAVGPASGALLALMVLHYEVLTRDRIDRRHPLLVGIVKKNAIMMIDFALSAERIHGRARRRRSYEAMPVALSPYRMMTTFAALFGSLADRVRWQARASELRRPLGICPRRRASSSPQWLTLYTTPVIYLYLDRLSALPWRARTAGRASPQALTASAASGNGRRIPMAPPNDAAVPIAG